MHFLAENFILYFMQKKGTGLTWVATDMIILVELLILWIM